MSLPWTTTSLGDLIRLERRPVEVVADREYQEIGTFSYGRGIFHKRPRSGLEVGNKDLFLMKEGDLILQITFAWEGAIALCSRAEDGLYGSVRYPTFRVNEERCFSPFLLKYLCTRDGLDQIGRICPGSAGRNRVLAIKRLPEIKIPLPRLAEQRRIVARIEELTAKIKQVVDTKTDIRREAHAMLRAMFARTIQGAPRVPLREIAPLVRRPVVPTMGEEYPELGIRSFGKGTFHKPALDYFGLGNKRIFRIEPKDLLFSNVFAWEGAIAVAQPHDNGRYGSHRFITCVPKPSVATSEFLCFYFLTEEGLHRIGEASPGGAGRNRTLGLGKLESIDVPLPDFSSQLAFDQIQYRVANMLTLQTETSAELDVMRHAILVKAFKGEL
jgi:type I restriction enzyme, S subunit